MYRAILILTLLLSQAAMAQNAIYRTTDKDGNVVFTDAPPAGTRKAEVVEMQPINTTPAPVPRELTLKELEEEATKETAVKLQEVRITSPANKETIPRGPGNFSVRVKVKPAMRDGQSLQLFMDGVPHAEPQRSGAWTLKNVFRGAHDLTVGLIDSEGQTTVMSEPVTVFVQRPGVGNQAGGTANPATRSPPKK